ncbi:MAG: helicase C-terminal domain-containing protein, partial [Verrucomicrobiota bacterium]
GGRIKTTIVVGPALAEVNPIQDAKMDRHPSMNRDIAFRDIYIIPAMQRIHQALGRLVRAPGHRARVLLHGKRFADPLYKDQLAPEYQDCLIIESEEQFLEWLS